MNGKSRSNSARLTRRAFAAGVGAAGLMAGIAPFNIVRAQGGPLKVGVLLPRSGLQAGIGQDCQRGVDIAAGVLKSMGLPDLAIMNGDTEFERGDSARASGKADQRRRPTPGRRLRFRADHRHRPGRRAEGHSARHQHRRERRQSPSRATSSCSGISRLRPMIVGDAFANQKEVFAAAGTAPKTVVFMHVNDTYGTAIARAMDACHAEIQHALHHRREDLLRSGGARPLGRSSQGQGDQRRCAPRGPAASTTRCC